MCFFFARQNSYSQIFALQKFVKMVDDLPYYVLLLLKGKKYSTKDKVTCAVEEICKQNMFFNFYQVFLYCVKEYCILKYCVFIQGVLRGNDNILQNGGTGKSKQESFCEDLS